MLDSPSDSATQQAIGAAFPVVGVGASAGGLEALMQLLKALPCDTGMAFVVVQHLAPTHASSLTEILVRATRMPVAEVRDEAAVQPDHVYVIPPGLDMIIAGGKLRLLPQERHARHRGIDQFFRSLAEDSGHQAIGVVLSGSATDGTLGLEVIKAEGGVTFAQDESAQHDSMPKSAVASGCVDFVLPPDGIAREIARIAQHPYVASVAEVGSEDGAGPGNHGRIAEIMRRAMGVDFTHYKANTMQRRIQRRMMVHKIETLAEYENHLRETPGEVEALYQDVLINVTSFFRNPDAFEVLEKRIFPKLLAERTRNDPVRFWTLGCSTGEEAYSLAILFAECAESAKSNAQLQLFASDLNASGIEKARLGRYPRSIAQDVSPERLRRFFVEEDGAYRVSKSIRERVVFSRHNVLADPPFSRVDFISCRNLLIYLEPMLQQQVMPLLHYALKPGGHLWLGSSESVGTSRALFDIEDARHKIFSRRPGSTPLGTRSRPTQGGPDFPPPRPGPRDTPQTMLHRNAERVLLAKYAPPGVVVNAALHVVQFRGETGAYLAPAAGLASHELLKMLREGLLVPVRAALERAEREGRAVREEGARVRSNGSFRDLTIEVIPLNAGPGREAGFVILFDEGTTPGRREQQTDSSGQSDQINKRDESEVAHLTQELAATREYLQSVVEQQDSVNEELQRANEEAQSANEEMQSVNEELETSKEEIQSSNEELATVNDELNNRNHELNNLNNDLNNVISSTQLSIVIVARDLRIRRFTPVAEKMFNLASSDVGRPLGDIKLSLTVPDLAPLLLEVINSLAPRERDVQDAQGRWFSLRARPYLTHDNKIDGAVVTLVDVDMLRRARDYAQSIVANVRGPLLVLDAALRVKTASSAFYAHFHVAAAQTEGRYIYDLGNRQWDIPALRTLLEEMLPQEHAVENYEVRHSFEEIGARIMLLTASRLAQAHADEPLIILFIEDITAREAAETARHESEERFRMMADNMSQLAWTCDQLGSVNWYNQRWLDYTGLSFEEMKDWGWKQCHHPDHLERVVASVMHSGETGEPWEDTFPLRSADGTYRWFLSRAFPIRDAEGRVRRWFGTNTDITDLRETEASLRRSEQRFRMAVSTVSSLIWTNSADGKMEGDQPGWENFTGQTREEYEGYGWARAVHPDDAQPTLDAWEQAVAEKRMFVFEHRIRRADGQWRFCSIRAVPMLDEGQAILEWVGVHNDITERRASEEALREGNQRLDLLAQTAQELILRGAGGAPMLQTIIGRVCADLGAEMAFTYLTSEPETLRLAASVGLSEEQYPLFAVLRFGEYLCGTVAERRDRLVVENLQACDWPEAQGLHSAGVRCYAGFPMLAHGRLLGTMAFASLSRDRFRPEELQLIQTVSDQVAATLDRARTSAALRASEQRATAIVQSIADGFLTLDTEWSITYLSPRGAEIFAPLHKTTASVLGQNFWAEFPEMIGSDIEEHFRRAMAGQIAARFESYYEPLGQWFDFRAYPSPAGLTIYFLDITERKYADEALRASEEFKRSIIESSPDCVKVLDLEGCLLSLEAGHELLGVTDVTPLLGKSWIDFWVRPEDYEAASSAAAAAAKGGEGKFVGFFRTLNGLDKWWNVAVTPIRNGSGETTRLLAVSRDVTEQRTLQNVLVARAEELASADRSKDEFLAMLAHELRNPLAPLRNATELLNAENVSAGDREDAQRIIARQIENMSRMLDDLLDISRITEGKIELRKAPVSLEGILTAATSLVRSTCAAHQQDLAVSMPSDPVYLEADATRLEQVFGNLLTNASKYSGQGSHIALNAQRDESEVVVTVSDDGAGIAPEILPRIFELFVQASRTLDRAHGGLGIGLTLVQRLVKLHGGTIEARSEGLGHGAEFIVRLPILSKAPPQPALPPRPAQEIPRRILIVDDNTDSARSLAILQTRRGHVTQTAFTGPDAVAAAAEFLPEVVLLDIGLPGMDGFEVARQIRAMPAVANAFIIAMSGYGREEDLAEAKQAGFDEYMVKPVDLGQLREWLRVRGEKGDAGRL